MLQAKARISLPTSRASSPRPLLDLERSLRLAPSPPQLLLLLVNPEVDNLALLQRDEQRGEVWILDRSFRRSRIETGLERRVLERREADLGQSEMRQVGE